MDPCTEKKSKKKESEVLLELEKYLLESRKELVNKCPTKMPNQSLKEF